MASPAWNRRRRGTRQHKLGRNLTVFVQARIEPDGQTATVFQVIGLRRPTEDERRRVIRTLREQIPGVSLAVLDLPRNHRGPVRLDLALDVIRRNPWSAAA